MLTLAELNAELEQFSYKPNFRFLLYPHDWEGVWMCVVAELPDSDMPTRTTVIKVRTAVPPIPTAEYFRQWLLYRLGRIEVHEMREFARHRGEKIDDPHAPDANE